MPPPTSPLPQTEPAGEAAAPSDLVVMGQILAPYGVRGWVNVRVFTESADGLLQHPQWWLRQHGRWRSCALRDGKIHGTGIVVSLEGVDDRDVAVSLGGAEVGVSRSCFPALGNDEYYWSDLIGVPVENTAGESLGRVVGLLETGAHDVLRVAQPEAEERLIPFVAPILVRVDWPDRIVVDWGIDF